MPPGAFLVTPPSGRGLAILLFFFFFFFFLSWSVAPDLRSVKTILAGKLVRLAFIRQNFHESWCRKLPAI